MPGIAGIISKRPKEEYQRLVRFRHLLRGAATPWTETIHAMGWSNVRIMRRSGSKSAILIAELIDV